MEQHPVPQDVTGFQFKLIGDMTVKQFVYLAAGVLLAYFVSRTGWLPILKWPLVGLTFFGGFALAFMPIEERPLDRWVINFFRSSYLPTIFVWKKQIVVPDILTTNFTVTSVATNAPVSNQTNRQNLDEYLKSLPDEELSPLDQEEKRALTKIKSGFADLYSDTNANLQPYLAEPALSGVNDRATEENLSLAWAAKVAPGVYIPTANGTRIIPRVGTIKTHPLGPQMDQRAQDKLQSQNLPEDINLEKGAADQLQYEGDKPTEVNNEPQAVHKKVLKETPKTPELKENKQKSQTPQEVENLKKKLGELQNKQKSAQGEEAEQLQKELEGLAAKFTATLSSNQQLQEQLDQLRKQTRQKQTEDVKVPSQTMEVEKKQTSTVKFVPSQMATQIGVPQPTVPNVLCGIIKDSSGEILTNVLIEVQDKNGNPLRALKTSRLGQFAVATPLENGTYTIHFEDIRGLFQFDIIEVTLDGKIFPAMEVRAKNQQDAEREKLKEALFGKQV